MWISCKLQPSKCERVFLPRVKVMNHFLNPQAGLQFACICVLFWSGASVSETLQAVALSSSVFIFSGVTAKVGALVVGVEDQTLVKFITASAKCAAFMPAPHFIYYSWCVIHQMCCGKDVKGDYTVTRRGRNWTTTFVTPSQLVKCRVDCFSCVFSACRFSIVSAPAI